MNTPNFKATLNFKAASIAAVCGVALLAAMPSAGTAVAADLPPVVKAPPKAAEPFNPFWVELDALAWTVKGDRLPALLTTSPVGTPFAVAGTLGAPTTTVLFGNSAVNGDWRAGGQLRAGYWFDPQRQRGIEASFFDLQSRSSGIATDSTANPILARPFFDAVAGAQSATFVAFPGVATGSAVISETSRLLGADALYRQDIGGWSEARISALIGYRYLHSSDKLAIATTTNTVGFSLGVSDQINASSDFHGVDLGIAGEWSRDRWTLEWRGKVALGANLSSAQVNGATAVTIAGVTTTAPGGMLALSSNIGNFSQTRFAAVPELDLKVGYQVAPQWRIVAGYDLVYWTNVQRAGGLIDTTVNPSLLPGGIGGGPQRPQPMFNTSPLLAQGFNVGVRYNY
jgi:hypothetical protein